MRSLVLGDAEAVRMLLHGCIVPSLDANFCSFGCIEVDKSKLLASASHSIEENDATENKIPLLSWLFAFLIRLISLISKNNVELINNLLFSAHRIQLVHTNGCLRIVVTLLIVQHHVQFSVRQLQILLEKDAVSQDDQVLFAFKSHKDVLLVGASIPDISVPARGQVIDNSINREISVCQFRDTDVFDRIGFKQFLNLIDRDLWSQFIQNNCKLV